MHCKMFSLFLVALGALLGASEPLFGYVAGTSGTPEGGFEVQLRSEWMRGLAGPETLPETQQKQKPEVNLYEWSGGYGLGTVGVFQDAKIRLLGAYYSSAAERLNGAEIYARDDGWILGAELSALFVHDREKAVGVFLRAQHPLSMNVGKFVNPKVDTFGVGLQSASKFTEQFSQETVLFVGSGVRQRGVRQNPSLSASLLAVCSFQEGLFAHGAALKVGPFYDGDLGERSDLQYGTQGVRAFRLGFTAAAVYGISKNFSLDATYTQKVTGAYFRATKDLSVALRSQF